MGAETLNWQGNLCILGVLSEVFSSLVRVMPRILGVFSEVFLNLEEGGIRMCSREQLETIIKLVKASYLSVYGEDIVAVILYGSYARGDYSESSDIDIVAIVKGERLPLQEKLKKVWDDSAEIGLENDVIVSPMVIPYEEFQKYRKTLPYYRNIEMEGKRVG